MRGAMFSPQRFGERLKRLRGSLSIEEASLLSGVAAHTLRRYERGLNEKIDFTDALAIGKAFGLSPNQLAALAGLWVLPESEQVQLNDEVLRGVERLKSYLLELDPMGQQRMLALIDLALVVDRQRQQEQNQQGDPLLQLLKNE